MQRFMLVSLAGLIVLAVQGLAQPSLKGGLPVGTWKIEFANQVVEVCQIDEAGKSSVDEPRRQSRGIAEVKADSVVITFADDRVERWTAVGDRFVVEHWAQGSRLPTVTPVLGIAERTCSR